MKLLYNTGIILYTLAIRLAALFSAKAALLTSGRKDWQGLVTERISKRDKVLWVHCASLGEFEQGRPVIEEIRHSKPDLKILLTFFSPSGYEIRKNYPLADCIVYLPADTPGNAAKFIKLVHPEAAIFVKYEFWHNYISVLHRNNIPLYLISGIFRKEQPFFRSYGSFFRSMLGKFRLLFVQDEASAELLKNAGINNVIVAGDTRFDRVVKIASAARKINELEDFMGEEKLFLAGSSWSADEEIISKYINLHPGRMKWVFAPHEIDDANIERLQKLLTVESVRFSKYNGAPGSSGARVLIIDNIGMLSSAYRYANIAEVGGGFGKGIHNILEPACWGIPVLFGPRHEKFREAVELLKQKGAMTFINYEEFGGIIDRLLNDEAFYLQSARSASYYVSKNIGATSRILEEIIPKI
ncbi:MAG TPA: glycosyltransferase N-terminal domain-containing protein [Bacteroidales bacterium]|nr:glycosyltransferase N-terminal domain-containing protein [Bacteroidales bacterium]